MIGQIDTVVVLESLQTSWFQSRGLGLSLEKASRDSRPAFRRHSF